MTILMLCVVSIRLVVGCTCAPYESQIRTHGEPGHLETDRTVSTQGIKMTSTHFRNASLVA